MNEEEKKAVELLENIKDESWTTKYIMSSDSKNAEILLNLIEKLQKENEELSYIISEIEQYALDEQINEESIDYNEFIEVQNMAFDRVYNKLQELLNKGE